SRDHDLFLFPRGGNNSGRFVSPSRGRLERAVVSGRKRWFLYPARTGLAPGGVHHAFEPADWLARVRVPMLTNTPAENNTEVLHKRSNEAVSDKKKVQEAENFSPERALSLDFQFFLVAMLDWLRLQWN
uniref:Spexin n=1 Tax=Macrostomum lignano TaxID=282301 RepID=A0A1I8F730_9PLAT